MDFEDVAKVRLGWTTKVVKGVRLRGRCCVVGYRPANRVVHVRVKRALFRIMKKRGMAYSASCDCLYHIDQIGYDLRT